MTHRVTRHPGDALRLRCPNDVCELVWTEGVDILQCPRCKKVVPANANVIRYQDSEDPFYEGAYEGRVHYRPKSERWYRAWPLWLINSGYLWQVRRHVPAGGTVLELGCAAGVAYFGGRYRMIGSDLSMSALRRAAAIYELCIQENAIRGIHLPDGSLDGVVSSYFWEHIAPADKGPLLAECFRVLRPGGRLLFLYDVETQNPLVRRMRRVAPHRYRLLFLDGDGHVGYETPAANARRFTEAGFRIVRRIGLEKTPLQSPSAYAKFAQWGSSTDRLFRRLSKLGNAPWFYAYTAALRIVDTIAQHLLPEDWARIELMICEKPRADGLRRSAPSSGRP